MTNPKKIFEYCFRSRNHGALNKYDHVFSGRNSRLDTIQSAVLDIKLKSYEKKVLKKRIELVKRYFKNLDTIKQIKLFNLTKSNISCFHQFVIRTDKRNNLKNYLEKKRYRCNDTLSIHAE